MRTRCSQLVRRGDLAGVGQEQSSSDVRVTSASLSKATKW
jgi:hypothetical protein